MKYLRAILIVFFVFVFLGSLSLNYYQYTHNQISIKPAVALTGRFVLDGSTCAGFEFGTSTTQVIWRNESECTINDSSPDYYDTLAIYWLTNDMFVTKDIVKSDATSPPRVDIYKITSYDSKSLQLQELWTGWGAYELNTLSFTRK
jgi:hypothetical protein